MGIGQCAPGRLAADQALLTRIRAANRLDEALYRYVGETLLPAQLRAIGGVPETELPTFGPRRPPPLRFVASRLYHRGVYRSVLKRARRRRAGT